MKDAGWIVDILKDVAAHAEVNGLPKTFDSLTEAMVVASLEINTKQRRNKSKPILAGNVFALHDEKLE